MVSSGRQDRFPIRVDLLPSDIDEVTGKRVLDKTAAGATQIREILDTHRNKLTTSVTLQSDRHQPFSDEDFVRLYPLVPYQLNVLIDAVSARRAQGGAPQLGEQITERRGPARAGPIHQRLVDGRHDGDFLERAEDAQHVGEGRRLSGGQVPGRRQYLFFDFLGGSRPTILPEEVDDRSVADTAERLDSHVRLRVSGMTATAVPARDKDLRLRSRQILPLGSSERE